MNVRVGLDFGTHQTKVCVSYQKQGQVPVYEFIDFGGGHKDLFLPSKLNIHSDGKVSVGDPNREVVNSFRYFKMASAEDEEFRGISGLDQEKQHYDITRYGKYTPEQLSIIFLAHVIGKVQKKFEEKHRSSQQKAKAQGLFGKFMGKSANGTSGKSSHTYYYQIGIPTEWSAEKNRWRRRKFEQILYIAHNILKEHSYSYFKDLTLKKVLEIVKIQYENLVKKLKSEPWEDLIAKENISAFPEAAAGLTYLVKTEIITEGYYLALDIGGGSSDISFFRVNTNQTFEYLASESLMIASNDVYDRFGKLSSSTNSTEELQELIESKTPLQLAYDSDFHRACKHSVVRLEKKIKKIYNQRVYKRFKKTVANTKFKNQSCFLYGGGSLLFDHKKGTEKYLNKILLHDQGSKSLTATYTYADVDPVREMDIPHVVRPENWKLDLPLLIVPLGLSFIQPDKTYAWNDTLYEPAEGFYHIDKQPELFDIFRRKWV